MLSSASLSWTRRFWPPAPAPSGAGPSSYVRVKEGGAKLRNVPDVKGEIVLDAASGALLAVYSERAGWLDVNGSPYKIGRAHV